MGYVWELYIDAILGMSQVLTMYLYESNTFLLLFDIFRMNACLWQLEA